MLSSLYFCVSNPSCYSSPLSCLLVFAIWICGPRNSKSPSIKSRWCGLKYGEHSNLCVFCVSGGVSLAEVGIGVCEVYRFVWGPDASVSVVSVVCVLGVVSCVWFVVRRGRDV